MHNHEKDNKGMGSMMWMMLICCAVPLILILLFGVGGKAFGASSWVIFGGVAFMLLAHFFMMRGHGHSNEEKDKQGIAGEDSKNKDDKDHKDHSGHGCCS
ncbi:MAG: hypothetical protein WCW46_00165 [Candidatus Paceibacterota bacterium]